VAELGRQVTEFARRNEGLEKSMTEMERKLKQRELMIKSLDNENQAVQLQVHVYTCIMFNIILISFIYASHKYGA
jgi:phage shock protein A